MDYLSSLSSCSSGALHFYKMWMTFDETMTTDMHITLQNWSSHCIQSRKHKPSCVLPPIIGIKCISHKSRRPLWNAKPSTHSQPPSTVSGHPCFKLTSPNMLPLTSAMTGNSAMYKMNYKESQFPSPCKCNTGSSFSLKGLIVSR